MLLHFYDHVFALCTEYGLSQQGLGRAYWHLLHISCRVLALPCALDSVAQDESPFLPLLFIPSASYLVGA